MQNLIIYKSNSGHTKRYAEALHTRIGGDLKEYSLNSFKNIKTYDSIFFGTSIRNNKILHIKKFLKQYKKIKNKNIFVFVTGISFMNVDDSLRQNIIDINGLFDKHIRLYLLPGGFDVSKMKPITQFMFRRVSKMKKIADKSNNISYLIENPIDFVNFDHLDKMVSIYKILEKKNIEREKKI